MVVLGGTITVQANGLRMVQPVVAVNGYLTSSDPRPHFGLGPATKADRVEILWPDGRRQTLENVAADQIVKVKSGEAN
jgi:hypothetical protein